MGATYISAVVDDFAVIKLRYRADQSVPIVSEAWVCPAATAKLFSTTGVVILD